MTTDNFSVFGYPADGVQGYLANNSGQRLVVRTLFATRKDGVSGTYYYCCSEAILDPGDQMSFQMGNNGGTLEIYRYDNGQAVGDPIKYFLKDNYVLRPETAFTPPGRTEPVGKRDGWQEGDEHEEIWGGTKLWVKRQSDSWKISGSDLYNKYFTAAWAPSDWPFFEIRVDGIAS
jgi:hypothetical protein